MYGIIYKGIGGFYYVKTADGYIIECKLRGIFRKQGIKPVAGDKVELVYEDGTTVIDKILPRKNVFVRPPVANVDQIVIVVSTVEPSPNFLVIDKLTAIAIQNGAKPIIVVTKIDLLQPKEFLKAYKNSGIPVYVVEIDKENGLCGLKQEMANQLNVLCGNSGVGKSTLLNALLPELNRETAEISVKLGRGRHTTREVELFDFENGQIADSPGFSSLNLQQVAQIPKEEIQWVFPDVAEFAEGCKFVGCSHIAEPHCAVQKAVEEDKISVSRYESYITLYKQAQEAEKY